MSSSPDATEVIRIHSFDGQTIWLDRDREFFDVGNFLGGGAAGTVYECEHIKSNEHFALKILNPLGYKILSPTLLRRCNVISKGKSVNDHDGVKEAITQENIWWMMTSSKQYVAGYFSERQNSLRELSLNQCIQVWGTHHPHIGDDESSDDINSPTHAVNAAGMHVIIPQLPTKFIDFIRRRNRIFREIRNMRKISHHVNVIRLDNVLELIQESKCTIFLVMELANGGELFDRIKLDCGTREETAKLFFQQLLDGVEHCHSQGVCHRDLKPEVCEWMHESSILALIFRLVSMGLSLVRMFVWLLQMFVWVDLGVYPSCLNICNPPRILFSSRSIAEPAATGLSR